MAFVNAIALGTFSTSDRQARTQAIRELHNLPITNVKLSPSPQASAAIMSTHQADAKRMLDDRGYTGTLIRGANPLYLFDKPVRDRIVESYYWKEQCFALNAATLCDRAVELNCLGGTYGVSQRPTPFLCLAFKLLQIGPEKDIVLAYLRQTEWKYLTALAAFYIRLTWEPVEIYTTLEPLLSDLRRLKRRTREGFRMSYIDEFVDELLTSARVCATQLWPLRPRLLLEDEDKLEPRVSPLADEMDELDQSEDEQTEDITAQDVKQDQVNGNGSSHG